MGSGITGEGLFIGLMSGTSADAVDAVLCEFTPSLQSHCKHSIPLPEQLRSEVIELATPGNNELDRVAQLDVRLGELFAQCANELIDLSDCHREDIVAIGSHGQTVRHQPIRSDSQYAYTVQIADPNIIAELTGITTVADFRRRDMAAGGQGAPLAPAFHAAIFSGQRENVAVVNLGGIANVTEIVSGQPVIGFDTGPANCLMDGWIQQIKGERFDRNGTWAASGKVLPSLLQQFLSDPYFQLRSPKSTGREYFSPRWLTQHLTRTSAKPEDVQATLLELTARTVVEAISAEAEKIYLCGGGAFNEQLVDRIQQLAKTRPVQGTDALGVPPDEVEPLAFAWLARQTLMGATGTIPSVTGASGERILGGIYFA